MNSIKYGVVLASFALAPLSVAGEKHSAAAMTDSQKQAVQALKKEIPQGQEIKVDNVFTTSDGMTCISYTHTDDNPYDSLNRAEHAVVMKNGDVERATLGNHEFENAWNDKCVAASKRQSTQAG